MHAGIDVMTPSGKEKCHAILLQCSADLLGRAIITNTKQFNGKWGCFYCTNPGMTDGVNHLHRYWPQQACALRTNASLFQDAADAVRKGDAVRNYCNMVIYYIAGKFGEVFNLAIW